MAQEIIYLTAEGLQKLKDELQHMRSVERPAISAAIAEARDKGDLSENAEYDAAREAQGLLEMRIAKLEQTLTNARVIDESKIDKSKVQILSKVTLLNHNNKKQVTYTIVSENEANLREGKLAIGTPIAKALLGKKKGDIVKATVSGVTQILKVTRTDAAKKHVLVGTVTIPVEPSSATRRDVHNVASVFSVDGKGSLDKFNAAANAAAVTPRIARIAQGDRTIAGLENSREVTRWAYGAKVEEISEIFNLGNAYVVAMLTEIDDSEYTSIDEARTNISLNLLRDKKFELIKEKLAGATIEDVAKTAGAEVKPFEGVQYNDFGVGELMLEPRLVGAIATTKETGKLSAPVKGFTNAVVFVVDNIVKSETQTAEAEKVRLQATNENVASQSAVMALQNMAEMEDLRGQYF